MQELETQTFWTHTRNIIMGRIRCAQAMRSFSRGQIDYGIETPLRDEIHFFDSMLMWQLRASKGIGVYSEALEVITLTSRAMDELRKDKIGSYSVDRIRIERMCQEKIAALK